MSAQSISMAFTAAASIIETREIVMIPGRDVYTLERGKQMLHVISGRVWLTYQQQDIILNAGEKLELEIGGDPALIAPLTARESAMVAISH